ncbi:MAG: hypothetical protein WAT39_24225 [Planctomycetota bacterium]
MATKRPRDRVIQIAGAVATATWVLVLAAGLVAGVRTVVAETAMLTPLHAVAWSQIGLASAAVAWLIVRRHRWPPLLTSPRMLRLCCYPWFLAVCAVSVVAGSGALAPDPATEKAVAVALAFALHALFLLGVLAVAGRWPGARLIALHRLDLAIGVTMTSLIGLEAVVVAWGRLFPSPLVWDEASTVSLLDANRLQPHTPYFGFRVNSLGYHDEEFFRREPGDLVICMLADSFGVGVVPFDFNYCTVAERVLRAAFATRFDRVAIHNFGVSATGPSQYVHLAETEVRRYAPDLVAVSLFVGNDVLCHGVRYQPRKYCTLQRWACWRLGARVMQLQRAERNSPALAAVGAVGDARATGVPDWVHDPDREPAHMAAEAFLAVETERVEVCRVGHADVQRSFARCFDAIDYLRQAWGQRLVLVLIPDEFQVEDELWRTLLANKSDAADHDRDGPQRRIVEHCAEAGIAVLDLLPILREHRRAGGPRAYHLRDTHWNATGNRIAGEALGRWLAERVKAATPASAK